MDQARNITFWGLILQPGKRYEQIVEKSFHVSMATLDMSGSSLVGGSNTQVMINIDGKEFILCHLSKKNSRQQALDLNFRGGDALALYVEGETPQQVHLTGYYIEIDDDDDMDDLDMSEMLEEEEEAPALVPSNKVSVKRKNESSPSNASQKKPKVQKSNGQKEESEESEEGAEESDTEGEDQEEEEEGFSDDEEDGDDGDEEGDEDEEDDDDDEEDDDLEEELQIGQKKNAPIALKKEKSPPSPAVNRKGSQNAHGLEAGDTGSKKKNPAKGSEQSPATPAKQEKKSQQTPKSVKRTLAGGVMVEELALGNGPMAKRGRPVSVYYVGRLKQNNKQFDATTGGPGFKFKLGGKEVIKGWDIGVEGMKVGGKRRITCPPHMAYGARGSPPVIPPNSVLVFDVTLKNVH